MNPILNPAQIIVEKVSRRDVQTSINENKQQGIMIYSINDQTQISEIQIFTFVAYYVEVFRMLSHRELYTWRFANHAVRCRIFLKTCVSFFSFSLYRLFLFFFLHCLATVTVRWVAAVSVLWFRQQHPKIVQQVSLFPVSQLKLVKFFIICNDSRINHW